MRGILLMCYGSYGKYAYNMAHSIRYLSDIQIHLICDKQSIKGIDSSVFTSIEFIDFEKEQGRIDVGLTKIKLFDRSPFEKTLYLDVDGIMLKNPEELFETLEGTPIYSQLMDFGKRDDKISYAMWASNEMIWEKYCLDEHSIFPTLQTSLIYFEKSAKEFFDKLKTNYKNRLKPEEYLEMWGKSKQHPDELYYGITMAQMNILPEPFSPVFFPEKKESVTTILDNYYVLSMYGGRNVKNYAFGIYDRVMNNIMRRFGKNHLYKASNLYKFKFINYR